MKLTITGYSTALFATWYLIEELGILFDAGDGHRNPNHITNNIGAIPIAFTLHHNPNHTLGPAPVFQHF
jgi:ribonuclease Z